MSALLATAVLFAAVPADPQVARLAGLARAWGAVKYVHPAMATSNIDWDAALIRAIPAVESAASEQEYRDAIAGLLSELGDPVTRVLEPDPTIEAPATGVPKPGREHPQLEKLDERTALVVVPNDAVLAASPNLKQETCGCFERAASFERVVLDLRGPTVGQAGWLLEEAISKCLSRLMDRDMALPPVRFLNHGFYMFQSLTGGPGGGGAGASELAISSAGALRGEAARTARLVIIVNGGTANVYPSLMALQSQGLGDVVQEGELAAAGLMVRTFEVEEGLTIAVRHAELMRPDGGTGFRPDAEVAAGNPEAAMAAAVEILKRAARSPAAPGAVSVPFEYSAFIEPDYSQSSYPDRPHRLLALFRLYSVIEYFFPYKDLMDRPWRETLLEFIPRMREVRDATEYALAIAELATRLQDSHVTLQSPVLDSYFGTHRPAVRVDLVESQTVLTDVAPELLESRLRIGDILVSVDGEAVPERRARLARYLPASTPGRLENKIDIQLLLGPKSNPAVLEVRGADGAVRRTMLPRTLEGPAPRARPRSGPVFRVLPDGYGYIDLGRLEPADVDPAFDMVRRTAALILDMRGYPSSNAAWMLVPRLAKGETRAWGMVGYPRYEGSSGTFSLQESSGFGVEPAAGEAYEGRVVVLADASSQSAAETVCLMVRAVTDATFIGARTSGANGGVTRTILPGGIVVNFTGYAVRNADGSPFQRVGIVPDIEARPTLRGLREGRDEVLERAIAFLKRGE